MKQKFIFLFMSITMLFAVLSSCNNNEEGQGEEQKKEGIAVFVKMSNQVEAQTYSVSPPLANNTPITFNSGDLYFVSSAGQIMKHMSITSAVSSGTNINLTDIQNGYQVLNVPSNVALVYIAGNHQGLLASGNYSVVEQTIVDIANEGSVSNVSLYGSGNVTLISGTNYSAAVSVKPIVSRLELTNIVGGGHIQSFQIDGIFINNYISKSQINGTISTANLVNNGSDATKYVGGSTAYPSTLPLYDYSATGLGSTSGMTIWPDAGHTNVWSYQVYPSSYIPHIIIRLSNIVTDNGLVFTSPQFLTITGFKNGSAPITSFEGGKVYNLGAGAFSFTEADLTPSPELGTISVNVTVSLVPWNTISVTPTL